MMSKISKRREPRPWKSSEELLRRPRPAGLLDGILFDMEALEVRVRQARR